MAFDPSSAVLDAPVSGFDPDTAVEETATASFDPSTATLEAVSQGQPVPAIASPPPIDRSFKSALMQGIDQPIEAFGITGEVIGAEGVGKFLRGATTTPVNYESASERFINPKPEDTAVLGFAPAQIPRALVEQFGQAAGSMISRVAGGLLGGAVGSTAGPGGSVTGAVAGRFAGPFLFGALQIVGPTALERAKRNGRTTPNGEDISAALLTAAGSGSLDAIGAQYLPGGKKLVGSYVKKVASSFYGEAATEGAQALVEQAGQSAGTDTGLELKPKEALGEALLGGGTGVAMTGALDPFIQSNPTVDPAAAQRANAQTELDAQVAQARERSAETDRLNAALADPLVQETAQVAPQTAAALAETLINEPIQTTPREPVPPIPTTGTIPETAPAQTESARPAAPAPEPSAREGVADAPEPSPNNPLETGLQIGETRAAATPDAPVGESVPPATETAGTATVVPEQIATDLGLTYDGRMTGQDGRVSHGFTSQEGDTFYVPDGQLSREAIELKARNASAAREAQPQLTIEEAIAEASKPVSPARDTSKPEQMTPEEFGITEPEPTRYPPSNAKKRFGALGLESPSATPEAVAKWKAEQKAYRDSQKRAQQKRDKSTAYYEAVNAAIEARRPIGVDAMKRRFNYEEDIPPGYVKRGDLYVHEGAAPGSEGPGAAADTQGGIAAGGPLLPNTAPTAPVVPIKAMSEIIRDIAKGIDVPIRFGRLTTNKFAGYFKKVQNLIGARSANDIGIVSHETGHKLDDSFGISKIPALRTELEALGDPATPGSRSSWTKSKGLKYKHGEGVAEFVRHWLTDPAKAAKDAPLTNKYFETVMDANPDFGDVMRTAREDVRNWRNAPAEARLDSNISVGDNPNKTRYRLSQLTRDLVDDLHMLKLAVDDATKFSGKKLPPSENPYLLSRLLRGSYGMADTFIRNGVADFKTRSVKLGTGFEDAVRPVSGRINEFRRWVVAKRAQELHSQGKETGLVRTDVDSVAAKYDSDPVFQKAFEDVKKWNDALLQYAVDSGYVSEASATAMRAMNQDYVPFHRIFEIGAGESPSQESSGTGRGLNTGKAGSLKRMTGSARDIVDPLETMIKNAYVFITASEKAAINRAIGELSNKPGMGKWVEEIAAPKEAIKVQLEKVRNDLEAAGADLSAVPDDLVMQFFQNSGRAPFGENVIKVTNAGQTKFYRLKSELFDAFNALDLDDSSRLIQVLSQPAQLLRAGVTLDPAFGLANVMRDAVGSAVINRYGMLPFEASARGMVALMKNPKLVAEWAASGGEQSFEASFFDRKKMAKFMRERITKDLTPAEQALVIVKSPLTALRYVSGIAEAATRIGEFERAFKEGVKAGLPEGEARRQASFESRDRQDFAKGGAKTKILRHMAAFWNAGLQGNIAVAKAFKERPVRSTVQGLAYVTLPTVALMALNWKDEDYWDRPQWERDAFWLIPIGKDANKRSSFLRIPKPFIIGQTFGTLSERLMRFSMQQDPKAFSGLMENFAKDVIPNPMPQVAQVIVSDVLTGKQGWDMWRNRPVVPDSIADLPAELQWTEQTSLTAKKIGDTLGLSPMKVDHVIAGTTGGLGRQVVHNAIDKAIGAATGEQPTATNIVPGARFFTTPAGISSQSVEDFYDKLMTLREQKAAVKVTGKAMKSSDDNLRMGMERTADRISELRKEAKNAKSQDEKQRKYLEISRLAKLGPTSPSTSGFKDRNPIKR